MREGQVEEEPHLHRQRAVMPCPDRRRRRLARGLVARIHARRAAEGVARELVEQDDEGERARRRVAPMREPPARRGLVPCQEAVPEQRVEGIVLREPARGSGRLPEGDDLARLHGGGGAGLMDGGREGQGESGWRVCMAGVLLAPSVAPSACCIQ
jgi:hypothetical protein